VTLRARLKRPGARALTGTLVGSAPGFIVPFAIAAHFGIDRLTDAYFLALALATFASGLLDGILLSNALPIFQEEQKGGGRRLIRLLRRLVREGALAAAATYLLLVCVGIYVVHRQSGWTQEERTACIAVLVLLFPYVAAVASSSLLSAALYVLDDFFSPAATLAFRSVACLAGLPFIGKGTEAVMVVASLLVGGELVRAGYLSYRVSRRAASRRATGPISRTPGLWKTGIPHGVSILVSSLNPVIDRSVAARLGPGSVTILDLGEKIFFAPLVALTSWLVIVSSTRWAAFGLDETPALRNDFRRTVRQAALVATGVAAAIACGTVALGWSVGDRFAGASTAQLQVVVLYLLLGLPAGIVVALGARLLVSVRRPTVIPALAVCGLIVNVVGDLVGAEILGVEGIALASTLTRVLTAALFLIVCQRMFARLSPIADGPDIAKETA
jgi:putative peptidoglycan lipid II flippase